MSTRTIGYTGTRGDLFMALQSIPGVTVVEFEINASPPEHCDLIAVEAPLSERAWRLSAVASQTTNIIVTTAPVAGSVPECRSLLEQISPIRLWSLNPLFADPAIRRMSGAFHNREDRLRTMFASTRIGFGTPWLEEMARLVDVVGWLVGSQPTRIQPVRHRA